MRKIYFPSIYELNEGNEIKFISRLELLLDQFERLCLADEIIVHGSFGDFTYNEFSDLEVTIVLSGNIGRSQDEGRRHLANIRSLVNQVIVEVDPIQHHGAFFLSREQVESYSEAELPLCVYEKAWSLRDSTLGFNVVKSISELRGESRIKLLNTLKKLDNYEANFFNYGKGLYAIKRVLSNFLMVPVFYYQSKGIECCKSEAISKALEDFPQEYRQLIMVATQIRNEWPATPPWVRKLRSKLVRDRIPNGPVDLIAVNMYRNGRISELFDTKFGPLIKEVSRQPIRFFNETV